MFSRRVLGSAVSAAALFSLVAACQVLVSSDVVQCSSDADCTARGGAFAGTRCQENVCTSPSVVVTTDGGVEAGVDAAPVDPKWGCLGNVQWPNQSATEKVRYRQRFRRLIGATPIVGVRVKACASLDPECTSPLAQGDTDAKGDIVLDLPKHFRGYMHVPTGPDSFRDMAPTILAVYPPPAKDANLAVEPELGMVPILVSLAELDFLLRQVGSSTDPNLGHVFGLTTDCTGLPSGGVAVKAAQIDPKTVQYYYEGNDTPSITRKESDPTGNAGFLNLPTGIVPLETTVPGLGGKKAGGYSVLVKKGSVTVIDMVPTP
jgi:hypothetical protein